VESTEESASELSNILNLKEVSQIIIKLKKKKKMAIKYKETCGMGIAIPLIFVILNQYFKNFVLVFVSVFLGKVERKWN